MMRAAQATALAILALLAGGCGESGPDVSDLSDDEVIEQAGFERVDNGYGEDVLYEECDIVVILRGEESIDLYRDAGDAVAVNDAGNLGAKVLPEDSSVSEDDCVELVSEALNRVE